MREPQRPDLADEAVLDGVALDALEEPITHTRLVRASMAGARLRSLGMVDVLATGLDAANADWTGAKLKRVEFVDSRLTGLTATELVAEDVVFRDCRLDFASFHRARIQRARFEGCDLTEADLSSAWLKDVRFDRCRLIRTDIEAIQLTGADLRGSELEELRGDLSALRGATIDPVQLVGLSRALAAALGIRVESTEAPRPGRD